jgi:DNA-binding MarR family transcriptional regulator
MAAATIPVPVQLEGWVSFLRAHAAITRELSAQLQREHGLTLNDYEVLLHLSHAEDGRMRRVDLAQQILLTASGITRLLEGLERAGYVAKETCASDARVSYAKVTDE